MRLILCQFFVKKRSFHVSVSKRISLIVNGKPAPLGCVIGKPVEVTGRIHRLMSACSRADSCLLPRSAVDPDRLRKFGRRFCADTAPIPWHSGLFLMPQRRLSLVAIPEVLLAGDVAVEHWFMLELVTAEAPGERVLGPDDLAANLEAGHLQRILKLTLPR